MRKGKQYKRWWMMAAVMLAVLPGWAQDTVAPPYPLAQVNQTVIEMGQMEQGSNGSGSIALSNQGAPSMYISKVRSSCGLMIPTWPEGAIEQNDTVNIRYRYDTSRMGPFIRKIIIHTNAWEKDLVITVKGEVIPVREDQQIGK